MEWWSMYGNSFSLICSTDPRLVYWSILAVVVISITLLAMSSKNDAKFVFASFQNETGWPDGVSWILGLLQSALSLIGFDAALHMVEEMPRPSEDAPRAIMYAIGVGGVTYVCPVLNQQIFDKTNHIFSAERSSSWLCCFAWLILKPFLLPRQICQSRSLYYKPPRVELLQRSWLLCSQYALSMVPMDALQVQVVFYMPWLETRAWFFLISESRFSSKRACTDLVIVFRSSMPNSMFLFKRLLLVSSSTCALACCTWGLQWRLMHMLQAVQSSLTSPMHCQSLYCSYEVGKFLCLFNITVHISSLVDMEQLSIGSLPCSWLWLL